MTTGDVVYSLRFSLIKILPEPGFELRPTAGESSVLTTRLHMLWFEAGWIHSKRDALSSNRNVDDSRLTCRTQACHSGNGNKATGDGIASARKQKNGSSVVTLKIPHSAKVECRFRTPEECLYDSALSDLQYRASKYNTTQHNKTQQNTTQQNTTQHTTYSAHRTAHIAHRTVHSTQHNTI